MQFVSLRFSFSSSVNIQCWVSGLIFQWCTTRERKKDRFPFSSLYWSVAHLENPGEKKMAFNVEASLCCTYFIWIVEIYRHFHRNPSFQYFSLEKSHVTLLFFHSPFLECSALSFHWNITRFNEKWIKKNKHNSFTHSNSIRSIWAIYGSWQSRRQREKMKLVNMKIVSLLMVYRIQKQKFNQYKRRWIFSSFVRMLDFLLIASHLLTDKIP